MKKLAIVVLILWAALAAAQVPACTDRRVYLESQTWWLRVPGTDGTDNGHVHLGACFPLLQTMAGVIRFDLRVILHENPGRVYRLRAMTNYDMLYEDVSPAVAFTCGRGLTCERTYTVYVDTAKSRYDGRQELRLTAMVRTPEGLTMFQSTGWQVYLANGGGRPVQNYRTTNYLEGRGWYTGAGYANARLTSEFPWLPRSGLWTFTVKLVPGAGGIPVTACLVTVDPDFHRGDDGMVLLATAGEFSGSVTLDTRKLANGPHRLVLRTDARLGQSVNSGLQVIPFTVQN